ncbi:hypothetical protein [Bdellovibrio svalbardensis]|uniref:Lipocalin-like domain-containing protein n=1 Tax=Bdellovibrio svalbardensis TaxID=2972972 RepID=A0ABT6DHY4_9BACT|nr:hypothetical protein [Bdellovibrio svalbardensis]MDG0816472.1 hypothetical protein [Bdellovibrio svalbardensis]
MRILGVILVLVSSYANAGTDVVGVWSSQTGTLCESSGETIERWESLSFKSETEYTQTFSFGFTGSICQSSFSGQYTYTQNEITFGASAGYTGCNGKTESMNVSQRKAVFSLAGDSLIITIPSENCGNLKTTYKKVQ